MPARRLVYMLLTAERAATAELTPAYNLVAKSKLFRDFVKSSDGDYAFRGVSRRTLSTQQENFTVYAKRFRVVSALMSFAIALCTTCAAQSQGLTDPNASAVAQSRAPHGRVMAPGSSIAHPGDQGVRAHTHLQVFVPEQTVVPALPLLVWVLRPRHR